MVSDVGWYHGVLAGVAVVVVVALLGLSAICWRALVRVGAADRRTRWAWGGFAVGSVLSSLIVAVLLVANAGVAMDPAPALLGSFNGGF